MTTFLKAISAYSNVHFRKRTWLLAFCDFWCLWLKYGLNFQKIYLFERIMQTVKPSIHCLIPQVTAQASS